MEEGSALAVGSTVTIRRTDGRLQPAVVSFIDFDLNCVKVEWFENEETKGKEIQFHHVLQLNPDVRINPLGRRSKSPEAVFMNKHKRGPSAEPPPTEHKNRRRLSKDRVQSAKSSDKPNDTINLSVDGKRIQSAKTARSVVESAGRDREQGGMKKINKLEKDRIERRRKQAALFAEKQEMARINQKTPYFDLINMITDYRNQIEFQPLTADTSIEDHLITVAVRKRPLNRGELRKKEIDIITVPSRNQIVVHEPKMKVDLTKYLDNHMFRFDYTFNEACSNEVVYKYTAQPLVKTLFDGGFATCFAYGQTGSGKTYTMSGNLDSNCMEKGIYALAAADVFHLVNSQKYKPYEFGVSCSFFEIYVKKVFDLLNNKEVLKILEDGRQQVQVVGLTEKVVYSVKDVLKLIQRGNDVRVSGQTSANLNSSRSHVIFQLYLRSSKNPTKVHGKFSLIDLAGNERGADTFSSSRVTRLEGAEINQSLLSLKECIRALGRKGAHLPFRGSKLTQILRDSFVGASSKTCMIAMVSPILSSCENSLNTLRYADRVKELGGGDVSSISKYEEGGNLGSYFGTESILKVDEEVDGQVSKPVMEKVLKVHKSFVEKMKEIEEEAERVSTYENEPDQFYARLRSIVEDALDFLLTTNDMLGNG